MSSLRGDPIIEQLEPAWLKKVVPQSKAGVLICISALIIQQADNAYNQIPS